ncbi:MAG: flippase-like domain-containing protein [Candidatus Nanopelagicales bacterium]
MSQPSDPDQEGAGTPVDPKPTGDAAAPDPAGGAAAGSAQGEAMPSAAKAQLDKKKTIIGALVTLIVLGLVFWALAKRFGSFTEAWGTIQQMAPIAIASLALVAVVNIIVYAYPYMVAIPGLKYKPAFMVRQTSWMIAALVPAGGAFAVALQYVMLASYRIAPAAATSGIAITSVWSFFMTFLLPVLGVLAIAAGGELQSAWIWAGVIGAVALIAMVIVFWLILRSEKSAEKVGNLGQKLADPIMHKLHKPMDLTKSIMSFRGQVVDVVKAKWALLTITNLAVSFMQFMILFVAVRGVAGDASKELSFAEIFAAFAISRLGTLIPLTPGGLGTVAGVLGGMLAAFGLAEQYILAAVVVWQVVQLLPQAITGIVTLLVWRVQQHRAESGGGKAQPAAA